MAASFHLGPVTGHIKASTGAESNVMKFYSSTNESTYGAVWSKYEPRFGEHNSSGFVPNNRPYLGYSGHLDEIDNPSMGQIVAGNFLSQTKNDYVGYARPHGKEVLPSSAIYAPSGFVREQASHIPSALSVQMQFIDSRLRSSASNVRPKYEALLRAKDSKDPISAENYGYGPNSWSTEYNAKFDKNKGNSKELNFYKIGPKNHSGFVNNTKTQEPISLRDDSPFKNNLPGFMTERPTGISGYRNNFQHYGRPTGRESLPLLSSTSSRQNGFTLCNKALPDFIDLHPEKMYDRPNPSKDTLDKLKREDPTEYINRTQPTVPSSIYRELYRGLQNPPETICGRLNRTDVGFQENTGHSSNPVSFTQTQDDPRRFITHNKIKFYDTTADGLNRSGHVTFGLNTLQPNSYTRGTVLNNFEPQVDAMSVLTQFNPYQAKLLISKETISTAPTKMPIA